MISRENSHLLQLFKSNHWDEMGYDISEIPLQECYRIELGEKRTIPEQPYLDMILKQAGYTDKLEIEEHENIIYLKDTCGFITSEELDSKWDEVWSNLRTAYYEIRANLKDQIRHTPHTQPTKTPEKVAITTGIKRPLKHTSGSTETGSTQAESIKAPKQKKPRQQITSNSKIKKMPRAERLAAAKKRSIVAKLNWQNACDAIAIEKNDITQTSDYKEGKKLGYQHGSINRPLKIIPNKSPRFMKGYESGHARAFAEIPAETREFNFGYKHGYAQGKTDRLTDLTQHSRFYREGYESGHAKALADIPAETRQLNRGYRCGYKQGRLNGQLPDLTQHSPAYQEAYKNGYDKALADIPAEIRQSNRGYNAGYARGRLNGQLPDLTQHSSFYQEGYKRGHAKALADIPAETRDFEHGVSNGYSVGKKNSPFPIHFPNQPPPYVAGFKQGYLRGKAKFDYDSGFRCAYHNSEPLEAELLAAESPAFKKGYLKGQEEKVDSARTQTNPSDSTSVGVTILGLFAHFPTRKSQPSSPNPGLGASRGT